MFFRLFSFLAAVVALATVAQAAADTIVPVWNIDKLERAIDLSKSYSKVRVDIRATNIGDEPANVFYIAINQQEEDHRSVLIPMLRFPKTEHPYLHPKPVEVTNGEPGVVYYRLVLPTAVAAGERAQLSISYIGLGDIHPFPARAPMAHEQTVKLQTFKYQVSPYPIDHYALAIIGCGDNAVVDYPQGVEDPVDFGLQPKENNLVSPEDLAVALEPNAVWPMNITYQRKGALPTVNYLQRDFWVSHWSNALQVEEYYELTNNAVELEEGFSRAEWMTGKYEQTISPAITAINLLLPQQEISSAYFTDKVGNVSTSRILDNKLALKPRYPIVGGWNYNFTVGWNHKLSDFLHQGPAPDEDDTYILKVKLLDGMLDCAYTRLNLSFYLPEGAQYGDVSVPFHYNGLRISHEYSYLDITTGHVKVTLTFDDLVDELREAEVYVRYTYPKYALIAKPLLTSLYVFTALIALYLLRKVNLSIKPAEKQKVN